MQRVKKKEMLPKYTSQTHTHTHTHTYIYIYIYIYEIRYLVQCFIKYSCRVCIFDNTRNSMQLKDKQLLHTSSCSKWRRFFANALSRHFSAVCISAKRDLISTDASFAAMMNEICHTGLYQAIKVKMRRANRSLLLICNATSASLTYGLQFPTPRRWQGINFFCFFFLLFDTFL